MLITWTPIDKRKDAEHSSCFIANVAGTGYAIGDKLIKVLYHDTVTQTVTFIWYNDTQSTILTANPTLANLRSCDDKLDVEVTEQVHTDLTSGEITTLLQHIVYNTQWVEVTRFYTDINSSTVFTPTWTVADEAVRVPLWTERLGADDTTPVALTVPPFTAGAHIDVRLGNAIKVSVMNWVHPSNWNGWDGHYAWERQTIILHSAAEINNFKFVAYDNTANGEIYVTYFNTDINAGI